MNKIVITSVLFFLSVGFAFAQTFTVNPGISGTNPKIEAASPNINHYQIALLNGLEGASLSFQSATTNPIKWYSYTINSNDSVLLSGSQIGSESTLTSPLESDKGYFVKDGTQSYYIWVIDYKKYAVTSITIPENTNLCEEVTLKLNASKYNMYYVGVNTFLRTYMNYTVPIEYNSMKEDETALAFVDKIKTVNVNVTPTIILSGDDLPLKDTRFTVKDDRFSQYFGLNKSVVSAEELKGLAVKAGAKAEQQVRDAANELEEKKEPWGGSAPVDMTFTAYANEPVSTYFKWDIATDNMYHNIIASYSDKIARYTFSEFGKYYVRLTVSNRTNTCVDTLKTFDVDIVTSQLSVPNVFSPNGDGKNDVFLVAYKSIVSFKGWIFNRYGTELFNWTDPAKGWDGKMNGKYVLPGVYFYVIESVGADGAKHNLKGAVNVFSGR